MALLFQLLEDYGYVQAESRPVLVLQVLLISLVQSSQSPFQHLVQLLYL